jgi:aminodeoxyfutalosine synthase
MKQEATILLEKVLTGQRLSVDQSLFLFDNASPAELAFYADRKKRQNNGNIVYYIQNHHIEPTNVCVFQCKFCAFSVDERTKGWSKNYEQIIEEVSQLDTSIRELHIVGGSNPEYDVVFYSRLLRGIRQLRPDMHIKAFTAAELNYMATLAETDVKHILMQLKDSGLDSIPGGGAEIFDDQVRRQICPDKVNAEQWLETHRTAHQQGILSNATMLYGHLESLKQRFEHMELLRTLQDETHGFQAFIPLKYKNKNNQLSNITETGMVEDLKMFALSRLFFDNILHLKVYWPAFGKDFALLAITVGADDFDGTINNSTKIYSMAGADETEPSITAGEVCYLIENTGYQPVERISGYEDSFLKV